MKYHITSGESLYRLKSVDLATERPDATFSYSRIVNVIFDEKVETALYPNPTVDMVKIKVDGQSDMSKIKSVRIFNMNGQFVLAPQLTSDEIDVQKLHTGTYLMQITRTNGIVSTLKLNIQK